MSGAAWVRITTSQVVSKVACLLRGVVVTPNGESNKGLVTLYDGESTGDPEVYSIRAGAGESKQIIFDTPLVCDRGLYVVLGSHVDECLVLWELKC
jgi:hypothetical protein